MGERGFFSRRNAVALFSLASAVLLSVVIGHGERLRKPDDEYRSISNLGVADEHWAKVFAALLGVLAFFAAYAYYRVISAPHVPPAQENKLYALALVAAGGILVFQTCVGALSTKDYERAHHVVAAFCFFFYIFAAIAAFVVNRCRKDDKWRSAQDMLCGKDKTQCALAWLGAAAPVIEIAFLAPFIHDSKSYFWGEYVCTYVALLTPLLYLDTLSTEVWFRAAPTAAVDASAGNSARPLRAQAQLLRF